MKNIFETIGNASFAGCVITGCLGYITPATILLFTWLTAFACQLVQAVRYIKSNKL